MAEQDGAHDGTHEEFVEWDSDPAALERVRLAAEQRRRALGRPFMEMERITGLQRQTFSRFLKSRHPRPGSIRIGTVRALEAALDWPPGYLDGVARGADPVRRSGGPAVTPWRVARIWYVQAGSADEAIQMTKGLRHSAVEAEALALSDHEEAIIPASSAHVCLRDGEPWPCTAARAMSVGHRCDG